MVKRIAQQVSKPFEAYTRQTSTGVEHVEKEYVAAHILLHPTPTLPKATRKDLIQTVMRTLPR